MVDFTRDALASLAPKYYHKAIAYYKGRDIINFIPAVNIFIDLMIDLEAILATDTRFMLGTWLDEAKSVAFNEQDAALYEYNAKNQVRRKSNTLYIFFICPKRKSSRDPSKFLYACLVIK